MPAYRLSESRLRRIIREEATNLLRPRLRESYWADADDDTINDLMYDIERILRDPDAEDLHPTTNAHDNEEKIRTAMDELDMSEDDLPPGFVKRYAQSLARAEGAGGYDQVSVYRDKHR